MYFKRELCQSACSSAICLIRRRRQTCGSTCRASAYPRLSSFPWTAKRAARAASPSWTTRIARSPRRRSSGSTSSPSRDEAWPSARPGRARTVPPGAPRPGGFSSPRPGGYQGTRPTGAPGGYGAPPRPAGGGFGAPRPFDGGARRPRGTKNFGPDAPPKHKRKPHQNRREQGPKPIKERPVSRLYENDEDWRAKDDDPLDLDNIATHKDADEVDTDADAGDDKD